MEGLGISGPQSDPKERSGPILSLGVGPSSRLLSLLGDTFPHFGSLIGTQKCVPRNTSLFPRMCSHPCSPPSGHTQASPQLWRGTHTMLLALPLPLSWGVLWSPPEASYLVSPITPLPVTPPQRSSGLLPMWGLVPLDCAPVLIGSASS